VLAPDPTVLFLDEVMSQLDIAGKQKVAGALTRLRNSGKTIIAVEHDLEAVAFSDRLMVLDDGKIICFEPTPKLLTERSFLAAHGLIDVEYSGV
ncbi:MAG: ABC transporter ATP-binding protein, partial [Syntrophomonadaceae bacterium]|nr:ABC transporter ATP-binding protein [Syntrophomonadaceae bacterium]